MPDTISSQLVRLFPSLAPSLLPHSALGWGCYNLQRVLPCLTGKFRRQLPFATFPFGTACCSLPTCQTLRAHGETRSSHCEGRFTCWTRQALIKSAQKVHGKRNCLTINCIIEYHVEISRFLFNVAKCLPSPFSSPHRLSVGAV